MSADTFEIYYDALHNGATRKIDETVSSDFIGIDEEDLAFREDVVLKGEAYLAGDDLIIVLDVSTQAILPCSICNQSVTIPLKIEKWMHVQQTAMCKSGKYNFSTPLREAIILEAPLSAECDEGNCPERQVVSKYLTSPGKATEQETGYHPFADLDWDPKTSKKNQE